LDRNFEKGENPFTEEVFGKVALRFLNKI